MTVIFWKALCITAKTNIKTVTRPRPFEALPKKAFQISPGSNITADSKMAARTSLLLILPCLLLAAAADPPAPQLFTAELVTDIRDTPIVIEVHFIKYKKGGDFDF